ncbi:MAG: hypothetical protein ACP5N1_05185 [Candidatus Woesearchaeota archaeon]
MVNKKNNSLIKKTLQSLIPKKWRFNNIELIFVKDEIESSRKLGEGYEPIDCIFKNDISNKTTIISGEYKLVNPQRPLRYRNIPVGDEIYPIYIDTNPVRATKYINGELIKLNGKKNKFINKFQISSDLTADKVYTILVLSGSIAPNPSLAEALGDTCIDPIGIDRITSVQIRETVYNNYKNLYSTFKIITDTNREKAYEELLNKGKICFGKRGPKKFDKDSASEIEWSRRRFSGCTVVEKKNKVLYSKTGDDGEYLPHLHEIGTIVVDSYDFGVRPLIISGLSQIAGKRLGTWNVYQLLGDSGLLAVKEPLENILGNELKGHAELLNSTNDITPDKARAVYEYLVNTVKIIK